MTETNRIEVKLDPKSAEGIPAKDFVRFVDGIRKSLDKATKHYSSGKTDGQEHEVSAEEKEFRIKLEKGSIILYFAVAGGIIGGLIRSVKLGKYVQQFKNEEGREPSSLSELEKYKEIEEMRDKFTGGIIDLTGELRTYLVDSFNAIGAYVKKIRISGSHDYPVEIDGESAEKYSEPLSTKGKETQITGRLRALDLDRESGKFQLEAGNRINCKFHIPKANWFIDKLNKYILLTVIPELSPSFLRPSSSQDLRKCLVVSADVSEIDFKWDENASDEEDI